MTVVTPARTAEVVAACARLGIGHVWLQQGSESAEAKTLCEQQGIQAVHGACVSMHTRPEGIHKLQGWLWNVLGKE